MFRPKSACMSGLFMESNVEEREPTSSRRRAQFSKIGGRQNSSPNGNPLEACTPVIFDGWNIHHTVMRGTWIRQSSVIFRNSQFSDNPKAFIYPTSDCPGQFQTIQDSIFVGLSANYGSPPSYNGPYGLFDSGNRKTLQTYQVGSIGGHGNSQV